MATIYVASFITADDYDGLIITGFREQTWADVANGFTCCAGGNRERVLAKAKAMFIEELADREDLYANTSVEEVETMNAERLAMIENDAELIEDGTNGWYIDVAGEHEGYLVIREFEEA